MKRSSLGFRLILSSLFAVLIAGILCGFIAWHFFSGHIRAQAETEASGQADTTLREIATIDQLARAQNESAMRLLQDLGHAKGAISLKGEASLAGKQVPDLHLGGDSQVQNFTLVDHVKALAGGTATLFSWDGGSFVRVSTNVLKPDGSRAVGTPLDPNGKAFAALSQGQSFSGVVDILGSPYITSYAPMLDGNGKIAGAWYTGYRLDSIGALGKNIQQASILDHGFVALLKPSGALLFHGGSLSDADLIALRNNPKDWKVREQTYPGWGYIVLTAYPASDVTHRILSGAAYLAFFILILIGICLLILQLLLNRQVIQPVRHLTERLRNADLNTLLEAERKDEIGDLAESFNEFVLRLRQTLLRVRDGSEETSHRSAEIRQLSAQAVSRMSTQSQSAEDASGAVARLSHSIADTSRLTDQTCTQARKAASAAREGGEEAELVAELIQGLSEDTQKSAARVSTLTERTQQIGSIVGVIEEIAAGTNLLALNASIEAARAGEHGRGFAVVAGEVRRLAERTAQATRQVSDLVSGIEEETSKAAQGILHACEHAGTGAEAVATLHSTFGNIVSMVIEVERHMEEIAHSAQQQSSEADAVSHSIEQTAQSSRETVNNAAQVVKATEGLEGTAQRLDKLVHAFNLREIPQDLSR